MIVAKATKEPEPNHSHVPVRTGNMDGDRISRQ